MTDRAYTITVAMTDYTPFLPVIVGEGYYADNRGQEHVMGLQETKELLLFLAAEIDNTGAVD